MIPPGTYLDLFRLSGVGVPPRALATTGMSFQLVPVGERRSKILGLFKSPPGSPRALGSNRVHWRSAVPGSGRCSSVSGGTSGGGSTLS